MSVIRIEPTSQDGCCRTPVPGVDVVRVVNEDAAWRALSNESAGVHQFWLIRIESTDKHVLCLAFKWHCSIFRFTVPTRRLIYSQTLNHVVCDTQTIRFLNTVQSQFVPRLRSFLAGLSSDRGRVVDVLTSAFSHFTALLAVATPVEPMPLISAAMETARPMTAGTSRSGASLNFADLAAIATAAVDEDESELQTPTLGTRPALPLGAARSLHGSLGSSAGSKYLPSPGSGGRDASDGAAPPVAPRNPRVLQLSALREGGGAGGGSGSGAGGGGPRVPPLQLPSSRESPLKPTRTSRRLQTPVKGTVSTRRPLLAAVESAIPPPPPKEELLSLASRLGQACAMADVPALHARRRNSEAVAFELPPDPRPAALAGSPPQPATLAAPLAPELAQHAAGRPRALSRTVPRAPTPINSTGPVFLSGLAPTPAPDSLAAASGPAVLATGASGSALSVVSRTPTGPTPVPSALSVLSTSSASASASTQSLAGPLPSTGSGGSGPAAAAAAAATQAAAELRALQQTSSQYNLALTALAAVALGNEKGLPQSERAPYRVPVNALYLELVHARRHPLLRFDAEYNRALCRALSAHAVECERALRVEAFGSVRPRAGRKCDLVVWRVFQRLAPILEATMHPMEEAAVQLEVLALYMRECRTSTMGAHVVDVGVETLLGMQYSLLALSASGRLGAQLPALLRCLTALYDVLDRIVEQTSVPHVTELLFSALVLQPDIHLLGKRHFAATFFHKKTESDLAASLSTASSTGGSGAALSTARSVAGGGGAPPSTPRQATAPAAAAAAEAALATLLAGHRVALLQHGLTAMCLLSRYAELGPAQAAMALQVMQRFEYLVHPSHGYLPRILRAGPLPAPTESLCLQLIQAVFAWRNSPFVSSKEFVDVYVHSHYSMVARVLVGNDRSPETLAACTQHLRILIALASHHTPEVVAKFAQLRVMDLLARAIDLEFQIHELRDTASDVPAPATTPSPPTEATAAAPAAPTAPSVPAEDSERQRSAPPAPPPPAEPPAGPPPAPLSVPMVRVVLPALTLDPLTTYDGREVRGRPIVVWARSVLPGSRPYVPDDAAAPGPSAPSASQPPSVEPASGTSTGTHAATTRPVAAAPMLPAAGPSAGPSAPVKFVLPPLKLSASMTVDGIAREGKPIVIRDKSASVAAAVPPPAAEPALAAAAPASSASASVGAAASASGTEGTVPPAAPAPPPGRVKFVLPPLKFSASITVDGIAREGKPIVIMDRSDGTAPPAPAPPAPVSDPVPAARPVDELATAAPAVPPVAATPAGAEPVAAPAPRHEAAGAVPAAPQPAPPQASGSDGAGSAVAAPVVDGPASSVAAVVPADPAASASAGVAQTAPVDTPTEAAAAPPPPPAPAPAPPGRVKFVLPPLKFSASITVDGIAREGKPIVIMDRSGDSAPAVAATTAPQVPALSSGAGSSGAGPTIGTPAGAGPSIGPIPSAAPPSSTATATVAAPVAGGLSQLEQRMQATGAKMHLAVNDMQRKIEAALSRPALPMRPLLTRALRIEDAYVLERRQRLLYSSVELHEAVLELLLTLLVTKHGTLDPRYADVEPSLNHRLNILFMLQLHLNEPANALVLGTLLDRIREHRDQRSIPRLLRLLCKRLFDPSDYTLNEKIGAGSYGQVYSATAVSLARPVAIKLTPVPQRSYERCILVDLFSEVSVLEMFATDRRVCNLLHYGTDGENYWLVMRKYRCNLKAWRAKQPDAPLQQMLPLYMTVYAQVLDAVALLRSQNVVHFDIKAENVLIDPVDEAVSDAEFYMPSSLDSLPFTVCLADFGESEIFAADGDMYSGRNRGTEPIKSPEMLTLAFIGAADRDFDRRKKRGAGAPSDVWSLGCLLYEIITGKFLFYDDEDDDLGRFLIRLTGTDEELIPDFRRAHVEDNKEVLDLLHYILVRDPQLRPTIDDVIKRVQQALAALQPQRIPGPPSRTTPRHTPRLTPRIVTQSGGLVSAAQTNAQPPVFAHYAKARRGSVELLSAGESAVTLRPLHPLTFVTPELAIGSAVAMADRRLLTSAGITHVVNASSRPATFPFDLLFLNVPPGGAAELVGIARSLTGEGADRPAAGSAVAATAAAAAGDGGTDASADSSSVRAGAVAVAGADADADAADEAKLSVLPVLPAVLSFVQGAVERGGKVLFVSDTGVSRAPALACAALMDMRTLSLFQASVLVRRSRVNVRMHPFVLAQLAYWEAVRRPLMSDSTHRSTRR